MRVDWVPYSAAALVIGASALSVGAVLLPSGSGAGATLQLATEQSGQWIAVSILYFVASVALTIGLPSVVILFLARGARLGFTALGVFAVGCIGIAGFAMLLVFFRSLAVNDALTSTSAERVTSEVGLTVVLFIWIGAFYLGELLLAVALLRARSTPRWVPGLLILHVALFPVTSLLPSEIEPLTVLLVTAGLGGVGITANQEAGRRGVRV